MSRENQFIGLGAMTSVLQQNREIFLNAARQYGDRPGYNKVIDDIFDVYDHAFIAAAALCGSGNLQARMSDGDEIIQWACNTLHLKYPDWGL